MAKTKRDARLRYLHRIGYSYYVRIRVPPKLQAKLGSHVVKALHTKDLEEANRRKWDFVKAIKADLARQLGYTHTEKLAESLRGDLKKAREAKDEDLAYAIENVAIEEADKLEKKEGYTKAKRFYELSTASNLTLDELIDKWAMESQLAPGSKERYKRAYGVLREHLGGNALVHHVDDDVAMAYVDELVKRDNKKSTIQNNVRSLSSIWTWFEKRRITKKDTNPWKNLEIPLRDSPRGNLSQEEKPFTDQELVSLFANAPKGKLPLVEAMALALLTGVRINALCMIHKDDITDKGDYLLVRIRQDKTKAGTRTIAVPHEIAKGILRKRLGKNNYIFPELMDSKRKDAKERPSFALVNAFSRYKIKLGIPEGKTFHSFRKNVATLLENLEVPYEAKARHLGHEIPTLMHKVYSGGSSLETMLRVARAIRYPEEVECAVREALASLSDLSALG